MVRRVMRNLLLEQVNGSVRLGWLACGLSRFLAVPCLPS